MNKEKMIKFLDFTGVGNDELNKLILESNFDLTNTVLEIVSEKIGEDYATVKEWYFKFLYE